MPGLDPVIFTFSENSNFEREGLVDMWRQNIAGHCQQTFENKKFCFQKFVAMFCLITHLNFSANDLNFHWRWRWWDWIQTIFLNLFNFNFHIKTILTIKKEVCNKAVLLKFKKSKWDENLVERSYVRKIVIWLLARNQTDLTSKSFKSDSIA